MKFKKKDLHVIFLAIMLIIIIIIVAKIMIWNLGTDSDYNPNELLEGFDTEIQDNVLYKTTQKEDDGVNNVLLIGNGTLCDSNGINQLPSLVADKTNSNVYTVAFPDATITSLTDRNTAPQGIDSFSFYRLCYALATGDFTHQDNAVESVSTYLGTYYLDELAAVKAIDMSAIDTIIIYYDGIDYYKRMYLYNPEDISDVISYQGSVYSGLKCLSEAYPDINIVMGSIHYSPYQNEDGIFQDSNSVNLGNGELFVYYDKETEAAAACSVSFMDNYYGSIHADNYKEYLSDYIHLNDAGMQLMADRISYFVNCFQ